MKTKNICKKYKEFFTKDFMMGPNSMRLLEEMLECHPLKEGSKVMDLGCGRGLTSLFLAKEAKASVYATDLWISATENERSFEEWNIQDKVIPIHANADDLPYAEEYFDAIVTVDSYHYFADQKGDFEKKVLPYLKKGGVAIIAIPGLKKELSQEASDVLMEWVGNDKREYDRFQQRKWWLALLGESEEFEVIKDFDLDCFDLAWEEWFASGHEYGSKDKHFFERGIGEYLSFVGLVIQRTGKE